jgi:hypothetical protein
MNKICAHSFWVCALSVFVVSCGSIGKIGSPTSQSEKAKIYVLRHITALGGGPIGITQNGNKVGKIDRGGILEFGAAPGKVVIEASAADVSQLTLEVEANKVYFVEVRKARVPGSRSRTVQIRSLSNSDGKRLLEQNREEHDPQRGMRAL